MSAYCTITGDDVGGRTVNTPHGVVDLSDFIAQASERSERVSNEITPSEARSDVIGRIGSHDIGRRVFWTVDDQVEGSVHYSVESDTERSQRIIAYLKTRDWVRISETIHHGDFRSVNVVGGPTVNYAVRQLLSISPYNSEASGDTATRIATDLIDRGHGEHGWARYDLLTDD